VRPDEARAWLEAHVNLEALGVPIGTPRRRRAPDPGSHGVARRAARPPQLEYPVVHVTGTNGKTSAVRLAAALLVESGLSRRCLHEPDLERVNERIAWNGHRLTT